MTCRWMNFCLMVALGGLSLAVAAAAGPEQIVRDTTAEVVQRLTTERAAMASNPKRLQGLVDELILPHVDFARMTALVMDERWAELSKGEQACLIKGLRERLVERYAGILMLYDEQAVRYSDGPMSDDSATVTQTIAVANGAPAVIGYRMQKVDDTWRVVDFTVDAVSLVGGYREQFRYEMGRVGLGDFLRSFPACRDR